MNKVFFFDKDPVWRQYIDELGIQAVIDHLKSGGHPYEWPLLVADPREKYTIFHPYGKGFSCYRSDCHYYEGYYLGGSRSAVKCSACQDLLPGIVVDTMCHKHFTECPFYKKECTNEHDISGNGYLPAGHDPER